MNNEYEKWLLYEEIAKTNMEKAKNNNGTLVEVAAQHPLVDGLYPNEEFKKRLDKAIELYKENPSIKIYVPGSIHNNDKISLSDAGKKYLTDNGVNENSIFGNETNIKYKGNDGVYNSSDECYVACKIFEDGKYKELYSICSSAQLHRKALSYIRFGYLPKMISISCEEMYHNYVDEIFNKIPMLIKDENGLQGDSKIGKKIREERRNNNE